MAPAFFFPRQRSSLNFWWEKNRFLFHWRAQRRIRRLSGVDRSYTHGKVKTQSEEMRSRKS
jgi:hypothetical protein